ncbi:alpha/beta hydrolase [Burkholderia stagnalis]|uniref:serine aminopeptidase domain-containing protein n=1 Tax=Burkholderia stagnalis TaxID=1503054 RepID=UPI000758049B|nr:alpha/beta hydrolase [Burkholderia stagnalis]AOK56081.1 alpha/beta hydrolase [Burkholderia stagnalis]KVN84166.1 alpha/beta hydrolase [Burkholderia stagnalis]KWO27750.1 alpha/beta hydrolase [Burkholderia stagnalis]KWO43837.1 alpha/beta hydrolase [Burkholderia stagnalis]
MKPIAFDGCVGWLHEGHTGQGVVLCEPLGHEALWTHKLTRALAERLARDGVTALRFNYPCAGDSAGDDLDAGRFAACVASIRHAIDALRAQADIDTLTLVGIRAGALFAMLAAAEDAPPAVHADAIVALAPVVRGRAYLRELSLVQRQWLDTAPPPIRHAQQDEPCLNVLGHRYPADLVNDLKPLDLCRIVREARSLPGAMLLVHTGYDDGPALRAALQSRGVDVATEAFAEWPRALLDGTYSRLPRAALETVAHWIAGRGPRRAASARARPDTRAAWDANAVAPLEMDGLTERVVVVGADRLVGVLCRPANPPPPGGPALLIATTAANPRSADGRVGVRIARAMARSGVTTLRIDVNGVGDSGPHAPDAQSGVVYSSATIDDVAAAAAWLRERGHAQVVALGVCSGAYASLHAAARDGALSGVIAINLARFVWPAGLTLDAAQKQRNNSVRGYRASMRDWRKWRRLVRERRDPRPILRALAANLVACVRVPVLALAARAGRAPRADTPRGVMHALAQRGVWTLLVYGAFDPGIDDVHRHFGPPARAFRRSCHVRLQTLPQLDHALYGTSGADAVIDLCREVLGGAAEWPARSLAGSPAARAAGAPFAPVAVARSRAGAARGGGAA